MRLPGDRHRSLKQMFSFSKPKGLSFGIVQEYYLSVLCPVPTLPVLLDLVEPNGKDGAIQAHLAPLTGNDKGLLHQPMARGSYVLASLDRKTVAPVVVMPRDEARFSPEPLLDSDLGKSLSDEVRNRIRAAWFLVQIALKSHDPMVYPTLDLVLAFAERLAQATGGVVADPLANAYRHADEIIQRPRIDPRIDVREHLSIQHELGSVVTVGMVKFGLPDHELAGFDPALVDDAGRMVASIAQAVLLDQKPAIPGLTPEPVEWVTPRTRWTGDVNAVLRAM